MLKRILPVKAFATLVTTLATLIHALPSNIESNRIVNFKQIRKHH